MKLAKFLKVPFFTEEFQWLLLTFNSVSKGVRSKNRCDWGKRVFVFPGPQPFAWPPAPAQAPNLYLPAPAPNLCWPSLAKNNSFTGPGPLSVFTIPGPGYCPQFVFTSPGQDFTTTTTTATSTINMTVTSTHHHHYYYYYYYSYCYYYC